MTLGDSDSVLPVEAGAHPPSWWTASASPTAVKRHVMEIEDEPTFLRGLSRDF